MAQFQSSPPQPKKDNTITIVGIVLAVVIGATIVAGIVAGRMGDSSTDAIIAAHHPVRDAIDERFVHTARFANEAAEKQGDKWAVVGDVFVTNAFGAELRHQYKAALDDNLQPLLVILDGKIVFSAP